MLHRLFGPFFFPSSSPQFLYLCLWLPEPPRILWHNILLSKKKLSFPSKLAPAVCHAPPILGWDELDESVRNLQEAQRH